MSEYQYCEFAAIDRPLTQVERAELRVASTRADITVTGFINHYEWGDLTANPTDWMKRYFDAFVYTANWCSCRLSLRVPLVTFSDEEVKLFSAGNRLKIKANKTHWIIDWSLDESENFERFGVEDGRSWMRRLVPLREELRRGDLRPLYLGWLAAAACGELDDEALEPEVPPGLSALSPAQEALVEFLEIDPDMLDAAAASSPVPRDDAVQARRLDAWLETWSREEMTALVKLLANDDARAAERQVHHRYAAWLKLQDSPATAGAPQRSVERLCKSAQVASKARLACEAKQRAMQEAEQQRQREAYLRFFMKDADRWWSDADTQVRRGSASGYTQAIKILQNLAQSYECTASRADFDSRLCLLLERHSTRGTLRRRLIEAGLWSQSRSP